MWMIVPDSILTVSSKVLKCQKLGQFHNMVSDEMMLAAPLDACTVKCSTGSIRGLGDDAKMCIYYTILKGVRALTYNKP